MSDRAITITADSVAAGTIIASIAGWLPAIAAVAGILWYGIQIYESKTVQGWLRARRLASFEKKRWLRQQAVARLEAKHIADQTVAAAEALATLTLSRGNVAPPPTPEAPRDPPAPSQ